jgi:hypothetical protein
MRVALSFASGAHRLRRLTRALNPHGKNEIDIHLH